MNNQPDMYNVSGGCGSGQTVFSSSATVPHPKVSIPCLNSQAKYAPGPPNTFWSSKMNVQPGFYNASGEYGSDQTVVSSSAIVPSLQVISTCRNSQESYSPLPSNMFWFDKMIIQPGMHNVTGEHGSGQTVVLSGKELIKPSHVISKRGYEGKVPCIYSGESAIGLPSVARSTGNKGVKHNKRKSCWVDNIHDSQQKCASE